MEEDVEIVGNDVRLWVCLNVNALLEGFKGLQPPRVLVKKVFPVIGCVTLTRLEPASGCRLFSLRLCFRLISVCAENTGQKPRKNDSWLQRDES